MIRVLFQVESFAQANASAPLREELRAQQIASEVSNQPQPDLALFSVVHLFAFEGAVFALRCALNALAQHKPFVVTRTDAPRASNPPPTAEVQIHMRALERAAQQFVLHHAARSFVTDANERAALAQDFSVPHEKILDASTDAYALTFRALAQNSTDAFDDNERAVTCAEDAAVEIGWLTHFADAYYYQSLTPQLEQDAARAQTLQAELRGEKRK